jgi:hypothetical protein
VRKPVSDTHGAQRKGRGEERVAKLQDSPDCPEREATYIISNGWVFLSNAGGCGGNYC